MNIYHEETPTIFDDSLYCPLNYQPCKWSDTDKVQCIPREHFPCTDTREEYIDWYEDEDEDEKIYPCQSLAALKKSNQEQGLSCKFVEKEQMFAYLTDQPVLSHQTSEMAERPDRIIPRFMINAHGGISPGTTTIPPNMSLTTWGAWGEVQHIDRLTKIDSFLSTKRERLTAEDIQKIYEDVGPLPPGISETQKRVRSQYFQHSRNTFPPTWKDDEYVLGDEGNRGIPYNKDCYKITLSSTGSARHNRNVAGSQNHQGIIKDTTMDREEKTHIIWKDGPIEEEKEGTDPWVRRDLTKILNWIYEYSNEKYGNFGTVCKLDEGHNKRTVDRIRVTLHCCLGYNPECIIGSCDSRKKEVVNFEQIQQDLNKRKQKILYRDPALFGWVNPIENMARWRIDDLPPFPYTEITPYDAYFQNLENWVRNETNPNNLIDVYNILTKQIYTTLFLEALGKINSLNLPGERWAEIKRELSADLLKFKGLLEKFSLFFQTMNLSVCKICRSMALNPEMANLDYSACQEYLIKTAIFLKLINLDSNYSNGLIQLEKDCLKSWLFLVIEKPDERSLVGLDQQSDIFFQTVILKTLLSSYTGNWKLIYFDREYPLVFRVLPTGAADMIPMRNVVTPGILSRIDKITSSEGINTLNTLYTSTLTFLTNVGL